MPPVPKALRPSTASSAQGYRLTEAQAQAILELRLQRLTGLERDKIVADYKELLEKIADLMDILARPERVTEIIGEELAAIRDQFGDDRRSEIVAYAQDLGIEDLITPQDMVVTLSHTGYIKSQPLADYRAQRRGGRGKQAAAMKDDDFVDHLFVANTHDYILCFSNRGRCYWLKVYEVPQGSRISRGKPIINMFPMEEGEQINAILPVKEFSDDKYVFMCTVQGTVKKTSLANFSNPRKAGIIAVDLDEGDYLIGADLTTGQSDIVLVSDGGKRCLVRRGSGAPHGPPVPRRARHDAAGRSERHFPAGGRKRRGNRAGGHRERLRQAHPPGRLPSFQPRHPGRHGPLPPASVTARSSLPSW